MFTLLLNLMTNQSYAQVTIECNTVESTILQQKQKINCRLTSVEIINFCIMESSSRFDFVITLGEKQYKKRSIIFRTLLIKF